MPDPAYPEGVPRLVAACRTGARIGDRGWRSAGRNRGFSRVSRESWRRAILARPFGIRFFGTGVGCGCDCPAARVLL